MKKLSVLIAALALSVTLICGTLITVNADSTEGKSDKALQIEAKSAILMDYDTGTIVFTKNDREHLPIASMVKIMTLTLTFEEIDAGRLGFDDAVCASDNAASMGGSQAFLDAGSEYNVRELIKSIVVGSANDSCVALAEHIAGDVDSFVTKMNEKAKSLGMNDTRFVNCTGLPCAEQYCCAYDAALMTRALISHKEFFDFSKIWMFDFAHPSGRITQLSNTNKLIRAYEGCDGGKTGFTNEAKYCLSATAKRGNTRLISVVCGAESSKIRNAQNAKLFNYGFANFETKKVVSADIPLECDYEVTGGKEKFIKAIPEKDMFVFAKKGDSATVEFKSEIINIAAPIKQGDIIGVLKVTNDGSEIGRVNLLSDRTVNKYTYIDIVDEFISEW